MTNNPTTEIDKLVAEYAIPREEARRLWYNQRGAKDE